MPDTLDGLHPYAPMLELAKHVVDGDPNEGDWSDLAKHVARCVPQLVEDLVRANGLYERADTNHQGYNKRCSDLEVMQGTMRHHLMMFGQHHSDCTVNKPTLVEGVASSCDCGLNDALKASRI
jgi:hypothetical protein